MLSIYWTTLIKFWVMIMQRNKSANSLPLFCNKCSNIRQKFFTGEPICKKECKYNPAYMHRAWKVCFKPLRGGNSSMCIQEAGKTYNW